MGKLNTVIRNSFHFLFSNGINFFLGIAASIVLARSLGPNDLGIFHQVQWFAGTVSIMLSLGLITSIIRFTARYRSQKDNVSLTGMVRFVIGFELIITITATIGLFVFASDIADHYFSPDQAVFFKWAFLALTPGMQAGILSALLEGAQVFRYQSLHSITVTPVALITKIVLMIMGFGIQSLFVSNLIFSLINLVFYFFAAKNEGLLREVFQFTKKRKISREVIQYNHSVMMVQFLDLVVWSRSENFFLGRFCNASQIAYYNMAHNLVGKILGVFPNLMWRILLPLTAEQAGLSNAGEIKKTYYHSLRYSSFAIFPLITICFFCAYELIVIFFGQEYSPAETSFQILAVGAVFTVLAQPGSAAIYATGKQKFILIYGSILAVFNLTLDFLLIPPFGATGAAICYAITTTFGAIGGFYYTSTRLQLKIPWESLIKTVLLCFGLGIVIFWSIRANPKFFDFFANLRSWYLFRTGWDWQPFPSGRLIRLLFTVFTGMVFYLLMAIAIFRPGKDDIRILKGLDPLIPRSLLQYWQKRQVS